MGIVLHRIHQALETLAHGRGVDAADDIGIKGVIESRDQNKKELLVFFLGFFDGGDDAFKWIERIIQAFDRLKDAVIGLFLHQFLAIERPGNSCNRDICLFGNICNGYFFQGAPPKSGNLNTTDIIA